MRYFWTAMAVVCLLTATLMSPYWGLPGMVIGGLTAWYCFALGSKK